MGEKRIKIKTMTDNIKDRMYKNWTERDIREIIFVVNNWWDDQESYVKRLKIKNKTQQYFDGGDGRLIKTYIKASTQHLKQIRKIINKLKE